VLTCDSNDLVLRQAEESRVRGDDLSCGSSHIDGREPNDDAVELSQEA
jgi:hypothetical protein